MSAYEQLKPWQQRFVDVYCENAHAPDATAAYRIVRADAKRPDVGASQLMARPEVKAAIEERLKRHREQSDVNEAWILERIRTVVEHCMQPVVVRGRVARAIGDPTNALRGLEMLGKHFAMWTDKVAGPDGGPLRVVQVVKFYDDDDEPDEPR